MGKKAAQRQKKNIRFARIAGFGFPITSSRRLVVIV